jgi:deoxyribodipyrimidine photo-lyase
MGKQTNTFLDTTVEALSNSPVPYVLKSTLDLNLKTHLPIILNSSIDTTKPTLIYNSYNLDPLWRQDEDVNRILLLEPSHFQKFPVGEKVIEFIINLSRNIPHIKLMVAEVSELATLYKNSPLDLDGLISKEHSAFTHYPGIKDDRDWIYPEVKGYFNSFFSFWKKCEKVLR